MQALVVTPGQKNSTRLTGVPTPRPGPRQALVRVLEVGLDGTDREIAEGLYGGAPAGQDYLIIGHESLGQVEEVGPEVEKIRPGDLVVATVRRPDDCINCRAGESDNCLKGDYLERGIKGLHGFLAEYYVEDEAFLVKVPRELRNVGVLLEPQSIVEKAIFQTYKIQERMVWEPKTAVVTGAGTIGLLTTMLLRLKGLEVYAYSRGKEDEPEARIAQDTGASYASSENFTLEQLSARIGRNIDLIVETTGSAHMILRSMFVLGTNGVLSLLGISAGQTQLTLCMDCLNLRIVLGNKVVFGSVNANRSYFEMGATDMLAFERNWPGLLGRLITRREPILAGAKMLDKKPGDIKVVVDLSRGPRMV